MSPKILDRNGGLFVPHRISSLSSPHLKKLKRLHRVRRGASEFLVEGTHLAAEAIAVSWPLDSLFFTDAWLAEHPSLLKALPSSTGQFLVDPAWLQHAATTEHPDGVVAVARVSQQHGNALSTDPRDWNLAMATDGIQDPGNAGTLLRMVVATGANGLFLSPDSVSPLHPKLLRSSAGQWFRSPPQVAPIDELVANSKRLGVRVLVADTLGQPLWDMNLKVPTLFIVGNEGAGVRPSTQRAADALVSIPMAPGVESLNVAAAGTILLYEAMRQRSSAAHRGSS